jgi:hypothetical protein
LHSLEGNWKLVPEQYFEMLRKKVAVTSSISGPIRLRRRKWSIVFSCLAMAGGLAICWFWHSPSAGRFTLKQYSQIRLGMSLAEVETIIGTAPGCYQESEREYEGPIYEESDGDMGAAYEALVASGVTPEGPEQLDWESDTVTIIVWLLNGRVVQKMYTAPESKLHRRIMNGMDWSLGSTEPRPFRSVPKPSPLKNN